MALINFFYSFNFVNLNDYSTVLVAIFVNYYDFFSVDYYGRILIINVN